MIEHDTQSAQQTQDSVLPTLVSTGLTIAHSWRARGASRTALFGVLGVGLPVVAEYISINMLRDLRHHTYPQVKGIPLGAALGWYNIAYATFAMAESLLARREMTKKQRRWVLPVATATVATSLDLILDCMGLDQGLWEWTDGGPYASDIVGTNGKHGIPLVNFSGWLLLTSSVTWLYESLIKDQPASTRSGRAGSPEAGGAAALLLLPYYAVAATWAIQRRKSKYLLTAA
jgi:uncharacterized membrane protein